MITFPTKLMYRTYPIYPDMIKNKKSADEKTPTSSCSIRPSLPRSSQT